MAPLPDTPELRKALKEIGDILDQTKDRTTRWLKRQAKKSGRKQPVRVSKENTAIGILAKHPDWSDAVIAKKAGANWRSMYRWKTYRLLRARFEELAKASAKIPQAVWDARTKKYEPVSPKPSDDD